MSVQREFTELARRGGRGALVTVLSGPAAGGKLLVAADPRYEPLTRGMRAALPHLDHLLPGNSIASLESLADLMEEGLS